MARMTEKGYRLKILMWLLTVGAVSGPAWGAVFQASIDQAQWQLETSRFECRLSQPIPRYGAAVFEHRAGENLAFYLRGNQPELLGRETRLVAAAPAWSAGEAPLPLGVIRNAAGSAVLAVGSETARRMLTALYEGREPTFSNSSWHGSGTPVKVAVSSVNFQQAYANYQGCVAQLLPVNFQQIARSAILFPSAQWQLSEAAKARLELIATYVRADSRVNAIFVDGHSDNVGRRLSNRDLSRRRAEAVTDYLRKIGVSEEMITTRFHGERYPVVRNSNSENRARNRRVTVRLERE